MHTRQASAAHDNQLAPWLPIPSRAISVVEHPCIVKNVDKGVVSLGGAFKLSKALRSNPQPDPESETGQRLPELISTSLRPHDPFAKRLVSTPVTTTDLLLKVTVPKRTGRKRKRGSSGPFLAEDEAPSTPNGRAGKSSPSASSNAYLDPAAVFQSLRDNASRYTVAPLGVIDETHRFRNLPDIQYAASHSSTMTDIRNNLLPLRYSQLKKYDINTAAGQDLTKGVGPSAEYLQMTAAFNYRYQQNTFVKYDGKEVNMQRRSAFEACYIIKCTAESVPTGPSPHLPAEHTLTPYVRTLIADIRAKLEHRPIISRHYLYNTFGWDKRYRLRQIFVYCGYFFESGPWREAIVKWGVDPRQHSSYRKYQTVSFLSHRSTGTSRRFNNFDQHIRTLTNMSAEYLEKQHTFDGVNVSTTGNLFQFCDITDPMIRRILDTEDIRTTCSPTFQGWYHAGTWAKATVILKDKMNRLISSGSPPDDSLYERIISWPESWDDEEMYSTYKDEVCDRQVHEEKFHEHKVMRTVRWAAKNPRYAFETLEKLDQGRREGSQDMEVADDIEVPEDATEVPDTADVILNEGEDEAAGYEQDYDEIEDEEDSEEDEADDSDSDDMAPTRGPAARQGPAPFGGLYKV